MTGHEPEVMSNPSTYGQSVRDLRDLWTVEVWICGFTGEKGKGIGEVPLPVRGSFVRITDLAGPGCDWLQFPVGPNPRCFTA